MAGVPPPHQLTPDEHKRLQGYSAQLDAVAQSITRLKAAGVDTAALEADYQRIVDLRAGMLRELAPPALRQRQTR